MSFFDFFIDWIIFAQKNFIYTFFLIFTKYTFRANCYGWKRDICHRQSSRCHSSQNLVCLPIWNNKSAIDIYLSVYNHFYFLFIKITNIVITCIEIPRPIKSQAEHWNNDNKPEKPSSPEEFRLKDVNQSWKARIFWIIFKNIVQLSSFRFLQSPTSLRILIHYLLIFHHNFTCKQILVLLAWKGS